MRTVGIAKVRKFIAGTTMPKLAELKDAIAGRERELRRRGVCQSETGSQSAVPTITLTLGAHGTRIFSAEDIFAVALLSHTDVLRYAVNDMLMHVASQGIPCGVLLFPREVCIAPHRSLLEEFVECGLTIAHCAMDDPLESVLYAVERHFKDMQSSREVSALSAR